MARTVQRKAKSEPKTRSEKPISAFTRLSMNVDRVTQNRFKASCNIHGQSLQERLIEVMRTDADAAGIPAVANS